MYFYEHFLKKLEKLFFFQVIKPLENNKKTFTPSY